jgi:hypothetical protein
VSDIIANIDSKNTISELDNSNINFTLSSENITFNQISQETEFVIDNNMYIFETIHNNLTGKQGGNELLNEFYHLSKLLYDYLNNLPDTLSNKVDKIEGYELLKITDKTRLANTSGTNTGDQDLSDLALANHNHNLSNLSEKSYNSLSDKPTIPAAQIQSDWTQTNTSLLDFIKNKPDFLLSSNFNQANIIALLVGAILEVKNLVVNGAGDQPLIHFKNTASGTLGIADYTTDASFNLILTLLNSGAIFQIKKSTGTVVLSYNTSTNVFSISGSISCTSYFEVAAAISAMYLGGATTAGTWGIRRITSNNNLLIQRYESGAFVTKKVIPNAPFISVAVNTTVTSDNRIVETDTTSGNITITFQAATNYPSCNDYIITKKVASNSLIIKDSGGNTLHTLTNLGASVTIVSTGASLYTTSKYLT